MCEMNTANFVRSKLSAADIAAIQEAVANGASVNSQVLKYQVTTPVIKRALRGEIKLPRIEHDAVLA